MSFQLNSEAFDEGGDIPQQHTCDGLDLSPLLGWTDPPEGTASLALICDDPDAPGGNWSHWVLWGLGPDVRELAQGQPANPELEGGVRQGTNDFRQLGYGGPCPPKGKPHRYFFRLFALDTAINLAAGADRRKLREAIEGHILAEAQLMGRYRRT
jgi:Raf kinase inhibitor-like YbhB/YbcL family protein